MPQATTLVDTVPAMDALCAALKGATRIGVDTEFHAERRYRPELLLLQLAVDDGRKWLVDPCAVDLAPLRGALDGADWVVHSGHWDIALTHRATGARPARVFDTQVLAGFVGHRYPARLGSLAHLELSLPMDKSPALSDWSRRPLSESQRQYAADDAYVILGLWDALAAKATAEHIRFALSEGEEVIATALAPVTPDHGWKRLDLAHRLSDESRASLHRLYAWRESEALRRDQPPFYVLGDSIALDLARRRPATMADLQSNRRFPTGLARKHGPTLLALVHSPDPVPDQVHQCPDPRLVSGLGAWRHAAGAALGIAPRLLLPDRLQLAVATDPHCSLGLWRDEVAGTQINAWLSGSATIRWADGGLLLAPDVAP